MLKPENLFSEQDKKRIADAVKDAEQRTSGEIVPFVVGRSDTYPEAWLRAGALLAFLVLFFFALVDMGTDLWLPFGYAESGVLVILAFGLGAALTAFIPVVKRIFIPGGMLQQRVDERAALAFIDEEVFSTRERTGILIFISLFERRVRILGDTGINAQVKQEEWDAIVQIIVDAIRNGAAAEGMLEAIWKCGELLERHGVEIRPDDTDELDNRVRFSDT
ncbi:MAG: TPM domain-containing protein [Bacteroidetes bacterium]|nr:TPM domain-containing protein [Bacteroidota bacterium]